MDLKFLEGTKFVELKMMLIVIVILHRSPENVEEGALVVELVKLLFENGVTSRKIGVITPYKAQVRRIKTKLKERYVEQNIFAIASSSASPILFNMCCCKGRLEL